MFKPGDRVRPKKEHFAWCHRYETKKLEYLVIKEIRDSNNGTDFELASFFDFDEPFYTYRLELVDQEIKYNPNQMVDDEDDL